MSKFSCLPPDSSLSPAGAGLRTFLNHEHALAYARDPRTTLVNMAACCLVDERSFYGDTTGRVRQLLAWAAREYPEWTLKLAVYLREELHLRSISQLIVACAATVPQARPFIARAFARVALRPDDMLEIAALLKEERHLLARSLPAVVRRAIGRRLNELGDVSVLRYRRGRALGLKHLLRLCHPRPESARQSFLFRYVLDRRAWRDLPEEERKEHPAVAAWEALSEDRSRDRRLLTEAAEAGLPWEMLVPHFGSSRDVWVEVAAHLPIMALLRNLSNLHATGALSESRVRDHVRAKLTDRALLRQSRLLPFRFLSAYNAMKEHDVDVARWIQDGLEGSVENLPRFPGLTAIACDNSGSMSVGAISRHSQVTPRDIAGLLGAIAARVCEESRVYVFAEECREVDLGRRARILSRAEKIAGTDVGDCTHAHKVVERLTKQGTRPRRLLIFTDMQVYREGRDAAQGEPFTPLLREFRRTHSPDMRTYIFNLQPYEHFMTPADESGVSCFSGWNENLLRYIAADSGDGGASMVERIDRMVL